MSKNAIVAGVSKIVRTQRAVLLGAAVLLGFVIAIPIATGAAPGPYAKAKLTCPRSAAAGSTISVTGSGFPANSPATFSFDTPSTGTVAPTTTSGTGTFSSTGTISPTATRGSHVLTVTVVAPDTTTVTKTCSIRVT